MVAVYELIPPPNPFAIDLQTINDDRAANMGLWEKIQNVALPTFLEYGKVFVASAGEAFWTNLSYMPETLRVFVIGNNLPGSCEDLLVRVGIWVVLHLVGFVTVTIYVFWQNMYAMPGQLVNYVDALINTKHIKAKDAAIDLSGVPDQITVETLLDLFQGINFDKENAPGYMNPLSRKEGNQVYTPRELRGFLENNFVRRVREREAFLGTPPAWNLAQLHQFYEQIEAAVRYSIHKVTSNYDVFVIEHPDWAALPKAERDYNAFMVAHDNQPVAEGEDDYEEYAQLLKGHEDYVKYNDLLQAKARVAIDLAIAGNHCGGRYMGDAMDLYFFYKGDVVGQTLEDDLVGMLANKREGIARSHIERYLGQNVHSFAAYMANLGGLLGIPGTQNVIEQLGGLNDRDGLITHFFEEYTPGCIRETVQAKFSASQTFRDRIYDWLKEHGGDWNRDAVQAKQSEIMEAVRAIEIPEEELLIQKQLETARELIAFLIQEKIIVDDAGVVKVGDEALPDYTTEWTEFLDALLIIPQARQKVDELLGNSHRLGVYTQMMARRPDQSIPIPGGEKGAAVTMEIAKRRNEWKTAIIHPLFESTLKDLFAGELVQRNVAVDFASLATAHHWMALVNRILSEHGVAALPVETLIRCCQRQANLEQVIESQLENDRHNEFLQALGPDHAHQEKIERVMRDIEAFKQDDGEDTWIDAVNGLLALEKIEVLPEAFLRRCFEGKADLATKLAGKVGHILPPAILEWILVAHGILNPPTQDDQRVLLVASDG